MARPLDAFPEPQGALDPIKAAQRSMWGAGDYGTVAATVIPHLGETLVDFAGVRAGDRVLDVAAGTGNAAIPAALLGADVVATDLTPGMLEVGERLARQRGAHLEWREADAEQLPFQDASFDVAMSCVGVMFAPRHQVSADELLRVTRPGGTIALLNWRPESLPGQMIGLLGPSMPPPPPGAQPPALWGTEEHLDHLFADFVKDVRTAEGSLRVDTFPQPEAFRDFFIANFGPAVIARRNVEDDPDRLAELERSLVDLAERHEHDGVMEWPYLLYAARRA